MAFILMLFGINTHKPAAQVVIDEAQVEAVFVPEGHEGVIIAIPGDEPVF